MAVATKVPLVMTTQVAVSVAGAAALIIPPVDGARVVLLSLVLGATALDTIQVYEGTVATPAQTLKIGAIPITNLSTTVIQCAPAADCLLRTAFDKGIAIDVTGGATVTGMASYYLEGAP